MPHFKDTVYSNGVPVLGRQGILTKGNSYFVDARLGSDGNPGDDIAKPLKSLEAAYNLCIDGNNDVVYLIGSGTTATSTAYTLSSAFTWAKDYTHLVGLCAPIKQFQRVRINQLSTATGVTALFTVSASGCMFENFQVFQGVDDATSLVAVKVTGQRNTFTNVHFAGIGHATMSAAGSASLSIDGGAENCFYGCTIGLDTITRDADATELLLSNGATRNYFESCDFTSYIGAAGFATVTLGTNGIDRQMIMRNCLFFAKSTNKGVTQTSVFSIPAISQGAILLENSHAASDGGATDWDSNNRGIIFNSSPAAAASGAGGILTNQ